MRSSTASTSASTHAVTLKPVAADASMYGTLQNYKQFCTALCHHLYLLVKVHAVKFLNSLVTFLIHCISSYLVAIMNHSGDRVKWAKPEQT
jgi:hypothetical protein